jgi:hypothetical protein
MVIPLIPILPNNSAFFEKIPIDKGTGNLTRPGKFDADKLSESGRIVVAQGLGISKGFEYRICLEDLIFQCSKLLRRAVVLSFTSARLSPTRALMPAWPDHTSIGKLTSPKYFGFLSHPTYSGMPGLSRQICAVLYPLVSGSCTERCTHCYILVMSNMDSLPPRIIPSRSMSKLVGC